MKREFLDQLTDHLITCGQKVSMGIGVGYFQSKASSPSKINFQTQIVFAIKTCIFTKMNSSL